MRREGLATAHQGQEASGLGQLLRTPSLPLLLIVAALAVGLAALVPLIQSSLATTTNGNIQRLERERADWQARLHELELEVARLGSLDRIEQEAKSRLNMVPPEEVRYIIVDVPAPAERRLPSRFLPPEPEKEKASPSLWERLFGWLP